MVEPIIVNKLEGYGLATVMARKGVAAQAIGDALALQPAEGPRLAGSAARRLIGFGPGVWLYFQREADPHAAEAVAEDLIGLASVSDQSSGYAIYEIFGPAARTVLQRGAPIDLDPTTFPPGSAATTAIAHIGVTLWMTDEAPTFQVAVFRSLSDSFEHWLSASLKAL